MNTKLREFIVLAKRFTKVKSEELMEKDFYLTILLNELVSEDFLFKGGTCLSKVYLDYYRLSEDIDLTWKDQGMFEGKSTKQIKKLCSKEINVFGALLKDIAEKYDFDFKMEKGNRRYVELGSNSKMVTFKIWYTSIFTDAYSFIKIQINFLEQLEFGYAKRVLKPILDVNLLGKEEQKYFEEFLKFYSNKNSYYVYDYREIACEKIRALLTRKTVKIRDAVDLYFIEKEFRLEFDGLEDKCKNKIMFVILSYKKYRDNFKSITKQKLMPRDLIDEDITALLLGEFDKGEFEEFAERFVIFLERFVSDLKRDIQKQQTGTNIIVVLSTFSR